MPSSYTPRETFRNVHAGSACRGRYSNASGVLRNALRLMEERERRPAALDTAISRGVADVGAGRVHDADQVFDNLEAELEALSARLAR